MSYSSSFSLLFFSSALVLIIVFFLRLFPRAIVHIHDVESNVLELQIGDDDASKTFLIYFYDDVFIVHECCWDADLTHLIEMIMILDRFPDVGSVDISVYTFYYYQRRQQNAEKIHHDEKVMTALRSFFKAQ